MKAIQAQTPQAAETATSRGLGGSLSQKKGEAVVRSFKEVLKKVVAQGEGKKVKTLAQVSSDTRTRKGVKGFTEKAVSPETYKLVDGKKQALRKDSKSEKKELDLLEKEETKADQKLATPSVITPKLPVAQVAQLGQREGNVSLDKKEEGSKVHLMKIQGRDVMVSLEDRRAKALTRKPISIATQEKKMTFFERELKATLPKASVVDIGEPSNFFVSESRVSSTQALINSLKRDSLNAPAEFWSEWEVKVDAQIVDKARIILKDGERGEIQLRLYPERLGNVRVRLDIDGTQVFARFVVDSAQVKEIFEANSVFMQQSLEQAGLNISLDFSAFGGEGQQGSEGSPFSFGGNQRSPLLGKEEQLEIIIVALSDDAQSTIDMII